MTLLSKLNLKPLVLLLALVALSATLVWAAPDQPIGEAARQRTAELANAPAVTDPQAALNQYLTLVWGLTAVVVVLMLVMVQNVMRLTGFDPFKTWNTNEINPRLMIAFLVLGGLALAYEWALHGKYALVGDSASAHGVEIDNMLITSLALTGIAFIIVQVLLFGYAYLYRARPGRKAIFWHDSQPLELGLAGITAVGLAFLVLGGVRVWTDIHAKPSAEALQIELVGEQFQWGIRYAGVDNKLGPANYKLIAADNNFGIDYSKPESKDDVIMAEKVITVPVGRDVHLNIRAKDVLHGVYMPHFRVQMYAVPGMPTEFTFKPIVTTAQMKEKTGNPNFEYEMACSQLCGAGHYNMKVTIKVVSPEEYKALAATWVPSAPATEAPTLAVK
jgi:cytochrome c oxidase subunit II